MTRIETLKYNLKIVNDSLEHMDQLAKRMADGPAQIVITFNILTDEDTEFSVMEMGYACEDRTALGMLGVLMASAESKRTEILLELGKNGIIPKS